MRILNLELGINEDTGKAYINVKALNNLVTEEDAKQIQQAANIFTKNIYKILEKNLENMET